MPSADCDALIVGAGPAGCGAARLLAAWGHRVRLVDRPAAPERALAESIPPSAARPLAALGLLTAIEDAGFHPWRGNTVWWADAAPRVESFPPGVSGYQVVRSAFDRRLRELAAESGAEILRGLVRAGGQAKGTGKRDRQGGQAPGGPDAIPAAIVEADGQLTRIAAAFVLDCSGRAGVLARQGLRVAEASHHTIALVAVWRSARPWPVPDDTHTLVASYADGWAWSVPTAPGVRYVTLMVDPARTDLARGASPRDVYRAELAKVSPFGPILQDATLVEGPWGADASLYAAQRYAGPGFLLVGDAASFIDPLSSFGVKKALASAWLAAIAVHTALVRSAMRDHALAFFDRRERAVYASAQRQAARFAADNADRTGHPFWLARATASDDLAEDDDPDPAALARDAAVLAAFEDLRARPAVRLRAGPDGRVAPRAAVRGREIVLDDHLFLPAWPGGIRYLRGVDLVALLRLAPAHADVGELYRAFTQAHPAVILPDFLGALSALIARGALRHA